MTDTSTAPRLVDLNRLRRARVGRRVFMTAVTVFVLAGLAGLWGVKERKADETANGWRMELSYAGVTRAGLAVPFEWTITKDGGFSEDETIVLRMTDSYFDLFDENSFDPTPTSEWSDGEFIYWEIETPPGGDTMTVSVDTRTGSSIQLTSMKAESAIVVDGQPVVSVQIRTWVMP